jgi:hypothetical protein
MPDPADLYTGEFYGHHVAGSLRSAELFLRHLFTYYRPASMVDFGAGVGAWLATARRLGVGDVLAVDGEWARAQPKVDPGVRYHYTDLEQPIALGRRFDLAMSVEVAEHLTAGRAPGFIADLTRAADIVLFGAAMRDQGGVNHVNEQDQYYWLNLFADAEYDYLDFFRAPFWQNAAVEPWYVQNTFLFVRSGHPALESIPAFPLIEVHHPRLLQNPLQLAKYGLK